MRTIGQDYIEYWERTFIVQRGRRCRFGLRLQDNRFRVVMKIGEAPPRIFGNAYEIPVVIESLPSYVRMIVDDHLHNCGSRELWEVLTGTMSFREALDSPWKIEVKRATEDGAVRFQTAS